MEKGRAKERAREREKERERATKEKAATKAGGGRHLTGRGEHDDRVRSVVPKSRGVQGARGIHHDIADAVEDNAFVNKSLKRLVDLGEVWLRISRGGGSTPI